jgi:hypothetical protein
MQLRYQHNSYKQGGAGQSREGRSSLMRQGSMKAELRFDTVAVWRGGGAPVHLGGDD